MIYGSPESTRYATIALRSHFTLFWAWADLFLLELLGLGGLF